MDKIIKAGLAAMPSGYAQVRSGTARPDDLAWSSGTNEFMRVDDERWLSRATEAEDFVLLIRCPSVPREFEPTRTYTVKREIKIHPDSTEPLQLRLF